MRVGEVARFCPEEAAGVAGLRITDQKHGNRPRSPGPALSPEEQNLLLGRSRRGTRRGGVSGSRSRRHARGCWRWYAGLGVVGLDHGRCDVGALAGPENGGSRLLAWRIVQHHGEAVLFRVGLDGSKDLLGKLLVGGLHFLLEVIGGIFAGALIGLFLFVNGLETSRTLGIAQLVAGRLKLLLERVNFILQGLELGALGVKLLLQFAEVALPFIGLGDGSLKVDDSNLAGPRGCRAGGGCAGGTLGKGARANPRRKQANEGQRT